MSPPSEEFLDTKTNEIKKISIVPKPKQVNHTLQYGKLLMVQDQLNGLLKMDLNTIMWIPTVKALKKRFEIYRDAKSKAENRDVPLGEGVIFS